MFTQFLYFYINQTLPTKVYTTHEYTHIYTYRWNNLPTGRYFIGNLKRMCPFHRIQEL